MADELNIKFSGDTGELEGAIKRVTGQLGTLNSSVEKVGHKFDNAFSRQSRKAIDAMRSSTEKLKASLTSLKNEELKKIKSSTTLIGVITSLRAATAAGRIAFNAAQRALSAFVSGILDAITSADEFITELEGIQNPLFEFGETTKASIEKVNVQLATMTGLSKALRIQLAEEFSPAVGEVSTAINHLALAYGKVNKKVLEFSDGTMGLGFMLADLISGGNLTKIKQATEAVNMVFGFQKVELEDLEEQFGITTEKAKRLRVEFDKIQKQLEKGLGKFEAIEFRADQKTLEGVDKITAAYHRQQTAVKELRDDLHKLALSEAEHELIAEASSDALTALFRAELSERQKLLDKHAEAQQKASDERIALLESEVKDVIDIKLGELAELEAIEANKKEVFLATVAVYGQVLGKTSEMIGDALKDAEGESKAQLKRLWILQKASAMGEAIIAGILATQKALAFGMGPPATVPMAAAVGVMAAVNVAQIAAQEAPFHIGSRVSDLAPDEMRITRREGLAIITPQGMENGAAEAVADANAGVSGGLSTVVFQYQHQMFDATIADNIKRPNSPLGSLLRSASYGHRRRGG